MITFGGKRATGDKRQQIQQVNKTILLWVSIASAIVAICLVLAYAFTQQIIYNSRVISALAGTNNTLKSNIAVVPELKKNVRALATNSGLNALKSAPNDTVYQVIIDALPTEDDRTALAASLQDKVLSRSGVSIQQVNVNDIGAGQAMTSAGAGSLQGVQTITFSFVIGGSYNAISKAIKDVEQTIRPISIDSMEVRGSSDELQATVTATTYYLPARVFSLGSQRIAP